MAESGEPIKVGVREFRGKLSDYLSQAQKGARFTIMSRGKPIAELRPPAVVSEKSRSPRILGALEGKIRMEPGWDEWPEEVLRSFEASL